MFGWLREQQFHKLYKDESTFLRSYLYQMGAGEMLDDVIQETFVKVWRFWEKVPKKNPRAYLVTMARNTLWDFYRKKSRHPSWVELDETKLGREESPPLTVLKVLSDLGDEDRELVILGCIEGWSGSELADLMNIPEGTVKSRLHKVRQEIKEKLEKAGVTV